MKSFRANGKLLLSGEYLVVYGGLAIALPCRFGQKLILSKSEEPVLDWQAKDEQGITWLHVRFDLSSLEIKSLEKGEEEAAKSLRQLLQLSREQNPEFLNQDEGINAETHLEFPRSWGLGSSSTLVSLIAQWAEVDPFYLQKKVFAGSGYDIACAQADGPILYKRVEIDGEYEPRAQPLKWSPDFTDQLYFVHLENKRNSREAMASFDKRFPDKSQLKAWLNTMVHLTMQIQFAAKLSDFEKHLAKHEEVISSLIGQSTAKALHFRDYPGVVKSLGAWGGDFVLVSSDQVFDKTKAYFSERGFNTIVPWSEMILQST
jgi:mevalonate kinase